MRPTETRIRKERLFDGTLTYNVEWREVPTFWEKVLGMHPRWYKVQTTYYKDAAETFLEGLNKRLADE